MFLTFRPDHFEKFVILGLRLDKPDGSVVQLDDRFGSLGKRGRQRAFRITACNQVDAHSLTSRPPAAP